MVFAIVYVCAIPARGKKCLVVSCFYNSSMHRTTNILIYGLEGSEQIVFFTSTFGGVRFNLAEKLLETISFPNFEFKSASFSQIGPNFCTFLDVRN